MDEIEELLKENPEASASYALREMHYGRLEWLAEHIRRCNFQISAIVARKILSMLERSEDECFFELKAVRRSDLPPRAADPTLKMHRDVDMALEVARRGGFHRAMLKRVCFDVGTLHELSAEYVEKRVRPFRKLALDAVAEEMAEQNVHQRKTDILDPPKDP